MPLNLSNMKYNDYKKVNNNKNITKVNEVTDSGTGHSSAKNPFTSPKNYYTNTETMDVSTETNTNKGEKMVPNSFNTRTEMTDSGTGHSPKPNSANATHGSVNIRREVTK